MGVKSAEERLDLARRELNGCETHLHQANCNWLKAEKAQCSHKQHHRFRSKYGDDYLNKLTSDKDAALRQFNDAQKQFKKAQADYDKATNE